MSYKGKPILIRLQDDERKWHILVHANDPRSFSCGFLEAVKHNRLCHNSNGLDELNFLVGVLAPEGGYWDYGQFDDRRLDSYVETFARHKAWRSLVEYETEHIETNDHVREDKIQQHIENAQAVGRYINLMASDPDTSNLPTLDLASDTGPLGAWFF